MLKKIGIKLMLSLTSLYIIYFITLLFKHRGFDYSDIGNLKFYNHSQSLSQKLELIQQYQRQSIANQTFKKLFKTPPLIIVGFDSGSSVVIANILQKIGVYFPKIRDQHENSIAFDNLFEDSQYFCCDINSLFKKLSQKEDSNYNYEQIGLDHQQKVEISRRLNLALDVIQIDISKQIIQDKINSNFLWGFKTKIGINLIPFIRKRFPDALIINCIEDILSLLENKKFFLYQKHLQRLYQASDINMGMFWSKSNLALLSQFKNDPFNVHYIAVKMDYFASMNQTVAALNHIFRAIYTTYKIQVDLPSLVNYTQNIIKAERIEFGLQYKNVDIKVAQIVDSARKQFGYQSLQTQNKILILPTQVQVILDQFDFQPNELVIMQFVNKDYFPIFIQSLKRMNGFIDKTQFKSIKILLIANLEIDRSKIQSEINVLYLQLNEFSFKNNFDIWRTRMQIANYLMNKNCHVMMSDVDALWSKDASIFAFHNDYQKFDIISSSGIFPQEVSSILGVSACAGFIVFRNTPNIKRIFLQMLGIFDNYLDDQVAINKIIQEQIYGYERTKLGYESIGKDAHSLKILTLTYDDVVRYCPGADTLNKYPNAYVYHCYQEKIAAMKIKIFKDFKIWIGD